MKNIVKLLFLLLTHVAFSQVTDTGDKVGIGTTTPSEKLEIRGGDGVGISLYNDQANYWDIKNSLYGKLDFVRGKSNIFMRITQNGYVGIGTTTPSYLLSIGDNTNSSTLFKVDGISSDVLFNGTHTNGNIWSFVNTGTGEGTRFYVQDANNSSSRLTFDFKGNAGVTNILAGTSNGNVGIGTISPDSKLTVVGHVNIGGAGNYHLKTRHIDGKDFASTAIGDLYLNYNTGKHVRVGFGGQDSNMYVSGNVGVGTTAPTVKLHINSPSVNTELLRLDNNGLRLTSFINYSDGIYDNAGLQFKKVSTVGQFKFSNLNGDLMTIRSSGNVGIGTTSPSEKLEVNGNIRITDNKSFLFGNSGTASASIKLGSDDVLRFYNSDNEEKINFPVGGGDSSIVLQPNSGFVGIGTTTPTDKLHVAGNIRSESKFVITGIGALNRDSYDMKLWSVGKLILSSGQNNQNLIIDNSGNIGIGTSSPDAKLSVKGNIHTNEVKVDLLGAVAPDYVFFKDYDLKSLKVVEDYIATEGHLPNIPSAEQMEEDGIQLKEMNLKLLEKIEELTLYTINQEKRIETLESNNKELVVLVEKLINNSEK